MKITVGSWCFESSGTKTPSWFVTPPEEPRRDPCEPVRRNIQYLSCLDINIPLTPYCWFSYKAHVHTSKDSP